MFPSDQKVILFFFVLFLLVLVFLFMRMMTLCSERGREYFLFCEFCDLPAYAPTLNIPQWVHLLTAAGTGPFSNRVIL